MPLSLVEERDDRWVLPLRGDMVSRCVVDAAFQIQFLERADPITVTIESPFIVIESGVSREVSPADPPTLGPVLSVIGRSVKAACAMKTGHLRLEIEDLCLVVDPDERYEAWSVVSDNNLKLICMPGGSVAVWT